MHSPALALVASAVLLGSPLLVGLLRLWLRHCTQRPLLDRLAIFCRALRVHQYAAGLASVLLVGPLATLLVSWTPHASGLACRVTALFLSAVLLWLSVSVATSAGLDAEREWLGRSASAETRTLLVSRNTLMFVLTVSTLNLAWLPGTDLPMASLLVPATVMGAFMAYRSVPFGRAAHPYPQVDLPRDDEVHPLLVTLAREAGIRAPRLTVSSTGARREIFARPVSAEEITLSDALLACGDHDVIRALLAGAVTRLSLEGKGGSAFFQSFATCAGVIAVALGVVGGVTRVSALDLVGPAMALMAASLVVCSELAHRNLDKRVLIQAAARFGDPAAFYAASIRATYLNLRVRADQASELGDDIPRTLRKMARDLGLPAERAEAILVSRGSADSAAPVP